MGQIALKILTGLHRHVSELDRATARIAAEKGLSFSQFMVLEALYSKGDMTIGEVRESILSSVGTISVIVKNLEKEDYIRRLKDPEDRRICILQLTESGRSLIADIIPQNEQMICDYMAVLSDTEQEQLLYLLKILGGKL